jgi:hypothetical protein
VVSGHDMSMDDCLIMARYSRKSPEPPSSSSLSAVGLVPSIRRVLP